MPHLFLHIGTPKTATTLFQSCCVARTQWLRQHGIGYPDTGRRHYGDGSFDRGHHGIGAAIRGNRVNYDHLREVRSIESLRDDLLAEAASLPAVIVSSEMLINLEPEDLPRLRVLLEAFDRVTIIGYVRRQDSWAVSVYGSRIK